MSNEKKKIEDFLHLYLGCRIKSKGGKIGDLVSVSDDSSSIVVYDKDKLNDPRGLCVQSDWLLLILRPLSDMTEEEILEMTLILMSDVEDKIDPDECNINLFHNDDGLMVDADIAIGAQMDIRCFTGQIGIRKCGSIELWDDDDKIRPVANQPMAFKWMLAKGFDLFGLIPAGLAIDKTQLNK